MNLSPQHAALTRALLLSCFALLVACGTDTGINIPALDGGGGETDTSDGDAGAVEDAAEDASDAGSEDDTSGSADVPEDDAADVPEDDAADVPDDDAGEETGVDVTEDVAEDVPDTDDVTEDVAPDAEDTSEDVVEPPPNCGDGIVQVEEGEECDDANDSDLDACTNLCLVARCGDGILGLQAGAVEERDVEVENPFGVSGPVCDTGASCPGTACDVADDDSAPEHGICQALGYARALRVEYGGDFGADVDPAPRAFNWGCFDYECFPGGNATSEGACGEGRMLSAIFCEGFVPEPCDDGENGFGPNQCRPGCELPVCGDGVADTEYGEDCDDANDIAEDGCNNCLFPSCGDGLVQVGEDCDDGNDDETDGCRSDCSFPECGDGFVQVGGGGFVLDADFESGFPAGVTFSGGDWTLAGGEYEGSQSARAASIGSAGATTMALSITLETEAELSFAYRVSSEAGWDFLRVYDGTTVLLEQSGEIPWTSATYPLEAGPHDLIFEYSKDFSGDLGEDTAFIDAITIGVDFTYFEECDDGLENSELPDACRPSCLLPACGDLIIDTGEACDDGNRVNDDGCSNNCQLPGCGDGILQETEGEACDDGDANADVADTCRTTCELPTCGDAIVDTGEECDDGNDVDDDGCSNICRLPGCGDGVTQEDLGEECDDGNDVQEDGCSNNCLTPQCGDGITQAGEPFNEECDDGNDEDLDACNTDCVASFCGDGIIQNEEPRTIGSWGFEEGVPSAFETVGAGWTITDDAYEGSAALRSADIADGESAGFAIDVDFPQPVTIRFAAKTSSETCCDELNIRSNGALLLRVVNVEDWQEFEVGVAAGPQRLSFAYEKDGSISRGEDAAWLDALSFTTVPVITEACDDGEANADEADACRTNCALPVCLDGIQDEGEECDDGNDVNDDTCSNACTLPICGDGIAQGDEECDLGLEGNDDTAVDGCRTDCRLAYCTDGVTDSGEECDDGNEDNGDGCSNLCREPRCGDGFADTLGAFGEAEECDDGNDVDDDTCSNACTLPICGDGIVQGDEECDDENDDPTDGCQEDCTRSFCGDGIVNTYRGPETFIAPVVESPLGGAGRVCDDGGSCFGPCTINVEDNGSAPEHGICQSLGAERAIEVTWGNGPGDSDNPMPHANNWSCVDYECGPGGGITTDNCSAIEMLDNIVCLSGLDEACDDGVDNADAPDACRLDCSLPRCGDGITDTGEECDDGNADELDGCLSTCRLPVCGDGILASTEECDDGNTDDGDTCNADCTLPDCGNGTLDPFEQCDDGNDIEDDLCRSDCTLNGIAEADENIGDALGDAVLTGTTSGAPNDYSATPECSGGATSPEYVVGWVPPAPGVYEMDLCGSAYDTYLYVREGAIDGPIPADPRPGHFEGLACDDDDDSGACGFESRVQFEVTEIVPYAIFVEGYSSSSGAFTLNIRAL